MHSFNVRIHSMLNWIKLQYSAPVLEGHASANFFRLGQILVKLQFSYECFRIWINLLKICWCYTNIPYLVHDKFIRYGWWAASMRLRKV